MARRQGGARGRAGSAGFTYLSLIILVAIIALVGATTLKVGSILQRSKAEQELLNIGAAFSDALQSYADATPAGQPPQPRSLKELLKDPRFPGTRRHLRKVFVDPMTGKAEWGIVYLGDKVGVLGVYSLSQERPIKIANFPARFQGFDGKGHISEWKFTMSGKGAVQAPNSATKPAPNPGPNSAQTPAQNGAGAPVPLVPAQAATPENVAPMQQAPNAPASPAPPAAPATPPAPPETPENRPAPSEDEPAAPPADATTPPPPPPPPQEQR